MCHRRSTVTRRPYRTGLRKRSSNTIASLRPSLGAMTSPEMWSPSI